MNKNLFLSFCTLLGLAFTISLNGQNFSEEIILEYPGPGRILDFETVDINNDGKKDILIGSTTSEFALYSKLNLGDGKFNLNELIYPDLKNVTSLKSADLNNDGYNDIVLIKSDSIQELQGFPPILLDFPLYKICLYFNDGLGNFNQEINLLTFRDSLSNNKLFLQDINSDGYIDILNNKNALINNGFGSFDSILELPNNLRIIGFYDLNNDGLDDLIKSNNIKIDIYLSNGSFFNQNPVEIVFDEIYNVITFGDIDNDNDIDILRAGINNIFLYKNNNFSFEESIVFEDINFLPSFLEIRDINYDEISDVLFIPPNVNSLDSSNSISFKLGLGNSNFSELNYCLTNLTISQIKQFKIDDFDGNGNLDIVCSNNQYSNWNGISKLFLISDIIQPYASTKIIEESYTLSDIIDVNGDGYKDFIFKNNYLVNGVLYNNENNVYEMELGDVFCNNTECEENLYNYDYSKFMNINDDLLADKLGINIDSSGMYFEENINNGQNELQNGATHFFPFDNSFSSDYNRIFFTPKGNDMSIVSILHTFNSSSLAVGYKHTQQEGFQKLFEVNFNNNLGNLSLSNCRYLNINDLDNDGDLDFVARINTGEFSLWENINNISFNNVTDDILLNNYNDELCDFHWYSFNLAVADLNNDGVKDILANYFVSCESNKLVVFQGVSGFQFSSPIIIDTLAVARILDLKVGDINNDNLNEIFFSSFNFIGSYFGGVEYYINSGNFNFENNLSFTSSLRENSNPYSNFSLVDIDGDTDLDIITELRGEVTSLYKNLNQTVSINNTNRFPFEIYPNPTVDFVRIKGNIQGNINYKIVDINQKTLESAALNDDKIINFQRFNSGLYIIELNVNQTVYRTKIILIK